MSSPSLKVIALISGGKDSLFSIQHCLANGHEIVALGNLYPPPSSSAPTTATAAAGKSGETVVGEEGQSEEEDMNSYMYQTVGHSIIPLYESVLGVPLYRQEILGSALNTNKDYQPAAAAAATPVAVTSNGGRGAVTATDTISSAILSTSLHDKPSQNLTAGIDIRDPSLGRELVREQSDSLDETESLVPLLTRIRAHHPEANAVSTGAILSTYQRTRIESIALRLGLTPLGYLWQYPILPPYAPSSLLHDMAAVGLDARIIKVASGGLDSSFLWENVASDRTVRRLERAMDRFDGGIGAVLGEGGEFETLAVGGPAPLWKGKIQVDDVSEVLIEGGSAVTRFGKSSAVLNDEGEHPPETAKTPRVPDLLDDEFKAVLEELRNSSYEQVEQEVSASTTVDTAAPYAYSLDPALAWQSIKTSTSLTIANMTAPGATATEQLVDILDRLRSSLSSHAIAPSDIMSSTLLLRSMSDFASINPIYAAFFPDPNPPARVTISTPFLPSNDDSPTPNEPRIILSVIAATGNGSNAQEHKTSGLHVQSRSYWAPANIGPYSQAISRPLTQLDHSSSSTSSSSSSGPTQLVHLAGQIPLVPASMELVTPSVLYQTQDDSNNNSSSSSNANTDRDGDTRASFRAQTVLSLQHLFRVSRAVDVFTYTGIVAFISACAPQEGSERARTATHAWRRVHMTAAAAAKKALREATNDDDEDNEDTHIDVWDLKHGMASRGARVGAGAGTAVPARPPLPDLSRIGGGLGSPALPAPFCLVAQVVDLPRAADVEWAGLGIAAAAANATSSSSSDSHGRVDMDVMALELGLRVYQTRVAGTGARFLWAGIEREEQLAELDKWLTEEEERRKELTTTTTARETFSGGVVVDAGQDQYTVYVTRALPIDWLTRKKPQIIPCSRLWGEECRELIAAVMIKREI